MQREFKPIKGSEEKVVISIRIDSKMLEKIDEEASKIFISRNQFINQSLSYALSNLKPKTDKTKDEEQK